MASHATTALDELWCRIGAVQSVTLVVEESGDGWAGVAEGSVVVSRPQPRRTEWVEAGAWVLPDRAAIPFRNALRWEITGDGTLLRLAHFRRGLDAPVELIDLAVTAGGIWRSQWPHECGDDTYDAELRVRVHDLVLRWTVRGPRKQTTLVSTYT